MSILKTLFSTTAPATSTEQVPEERSAFDAANAAIDRAVAERLASEAADERRLNEPNRRKGGLDTRLPGSPDRRKTPQPSFGRRHVPE